MRTKHDKIKLMTYIQYIQQFWREKKQKKKVYQLHNNKVHPITDNKGPEVEQRYSSTLSLNSKLNGSRSMPHSTHFNPGKDLVNQT